jgi:HAD superfamily hydrolase (TIGR01549 family)
MIKVISFDLDGTLAEENFDKVIWFEEIPRLFAEKYKIPVEEAKEKVFAEYDSKNEHYQWTDVSYWFQSFGLEGHKKLLDDMKHHIKMFPDAVPTLKELSKKYKLIVITSAEKNFLDLKLKVDGIGGFFSCVFSMPNDFKKLKKDESAYKKIIERLSIKPEEMIHVGDSYNSDYLVPKKVGINSFFLDRAKEKSGKDIVHNLSEFAKKIKEIE